MRATTDTWRAQRVRGAYLGALVSLLVHAIAYGFLTWAGTMPAVDFRVELPSHVEFGVTDAIAVPPPPPSPQSPTAAAQESPAHDAPKPKPRPSTTARAAADAGAPDAGAAQLARKPASAAAPANTPQQPTLSAFAPKGAQLALRLDMAKIRDSELAQDVRRLLEAVPDWRLIVDGSGLDPLRDLERLYLASPDLQRSSVVIAGQYAGDEDLPRRAVESLAAARGVAANFRSYGAILVAPWANADDTERVLALIAPHQFAITRPDDLPRVLQVARALARRKQKAAAPAIDPGDALLALEPSQILGFSVEGARLFVRGNTQGVPLRLEIGVRKADGPGFDVTLEGSYENATAAAVAREYWARMRDRFEQHPLLGLIGMRTPLEDARITSRETVVEVTTQVGVQQARVLLGFVENAISPPNP